MASITTYLDFGNEPVMIPNAIPGTSNSEAKKLQVFIDQFEEQYLKYILGYELYELFINGVGDGSLYDNLKDGDTFTDELNLLQKWEGFSHPGKNPIACYIFWFWQNSNASNTFGHGEASANVENGTRVSPAPKARKAWNEMVKFNTKLHGYLFAKRALFPKYIGLSFPPTGFIPRNGGYADEVIQYQNLFIKQTWI